MPKLKTPILSLEAKGRLGKLFSLAKRQGRNIIERRPFPTDAQSSSQLFNRHMFTKCVDLWHLLSDAEKQEWESLARSRHMTGYAWYISQCLRPNPGIYLPLQGGTMAGNIDMAKNRLLKLPLPTVAQEAASKAYVDALAPGLHAATHELGGGDLISVAGLLGLLATPQTPIVHGAAKHTDVTRELFIPASEGYALTGTLGGGSSHSWVAGGANLNEPEVKFTTKVPDDFVSFASVKAVWYSGAVAGNMYWYLRARYEASGEIIGAHSDTPGLGVTATVGANLFNVQEPFTPLTLANLAVGDYLGLEFYRAGANALDTLDSTVQFFGLLFTYVANQ